MSVLRMRYGGEEVSIPEGFNFNANYGTAKINIKVNSSSTAKFGLTTNTNAKNYCKLQLRLGGQIVFIGRVSSTSYISGAQVDYNGSSMTSRSQSVSTASDISQSAGTLPCVIQTSSMSTKTGSVTRVTSVKTAAQTSAAGNGSGTAAANPTIRTVTNATGSTVTTRTASADIASQTIYSYSRKTITTSTTYNFDVNLIYSQRNESKQTIMFKVRNATVGNTIANAAASTVVTSLKQSIVTTTTRNFRLATTISNVAFNISHILTATNSAITLQITQSSKYYIKSTTSGYKGYKYSFSASTYSPTTQYVHHYNSSKRWSYWWTSCKKYTGSTSYTGTTYYTSATRSTTSVSETVHNMNV